MAKKTPVGRRGFLKGAASAAAGAAALATSAPPAKAQAPERAPATPLPSAALAANEKSSPAARVDVYTTDRPGSDFMVDVIKSLGFEYVCANPGSSFRGLHESLINYGGNKTPELHHLLPRRIVGGDGARLRQDRRQAADGRWRTARWDCSTRPWRSITPMRTACRCTSCSATFRTSTARRSDVEWAHSVQDAAAMVRDYTKWDDNAGVAEPLRGIRGARVQDRDDAADGAGRPRGRRACCRKNRCRRPTGALRDSETHAVDAARGRFGRGGRSREDAGGGGESGDRRRTRGAHSARASSCWWNWPRRLQAPVQDRHFRMNFPVAASA